MPTQGSSRGNAPSFIKRSESFLGPFWFVLLGVRGAASGIFCPDSVPDHIPELPVRFLRVNHPGGPSVVLGRTNILNVETSKALRPGGVFRQDDVIYIDRLLCDAAARAAGPGGLAA